MQRSSSRGASVFARRVISGLVFLATAHTGLADDHPNGVVQTVLAAWDQRRMSIRSFVYRFEVEWSLPAGSRNDLGRAFMRQHGSSVPSKDVLLRSSWTFAFSRGKMAVTQKGEGWSDQANSVRAHETAASFDGSESKTMFMERTNPFGMGELITGNRPPDVLANHANLISLWLTFSPLEQLQRLGCNTDDIASDPSRVSYDGHDGVQLRFSSRSNPSRMTFVIADPSRDWLPMRMMRERAGHPTSDLAIHYVENSEIGWRVSGWEWIQFSDSGKVTDSRLGKIVECSINGPVTDKLLTFQFPEGTNVIEQNGDTRKYFVALTNGKRRYITEREFGLLPASAVDASRTGTSTRIMLATLGGALILGVFVLWLRRK